MTTEAEHRECDQGLGGVEPEGASGEQPDAGVDGLDVVRRLIQQAPPRLKPRGTLVFEIGFGQAAAVEQLISASPGLRMVGLRRDLQGIPRTAVTERRT